MHARAGANHSRARALRAGEGGGQQSQLLRSWGDAARAGKVSQQAVCLEELRRAAGSAGTAGAGQTVPMLKAYYWMVSDALVQLVRPH